MVKKRRKRTSKKKQLELKKQREIIFSCIILSLLVFSSTYFLFNSNILTTSIDEVAANYISFNNYKTTDMLKISNLSKMKKTQGKSILNSNSLTFEVTGDVGSNYEIVVYALGNEIDEEYINFYLCDTSKLNSGNLAEVEYSNDGGKIIYQGIVEDNTKLKLNMWISNKYQGNTKNISYEIKIKPR